ncbi:hypothetical protein DFH06DRAFT_1222851 [Mycena polygramma]|nr:hypothetical protein DFH06DRAFT_1222851 [Mycena polygramma]
MSSPFTPQLGTNYCPSDKEVLEINDLLVEPRHRLKQLDDKIANLQKAMDELAEEREGVDAFVSAHNALISPLRRMPLDIIQEIFLACLPTHRNCVMSASEAPVLLGRICSSWRAISLSTPRLWASLHIVRPTRPGPNELESFEKKCVQRLETIKIWLDRSGECGLSISMETGVEPEIFFNGPPAADTVPLSPPRLFLQALVPFASRWRKIAISTSRTELLAAFSNLTESDVPILSEITVYEHPDLVDHGVTDLAFELPESETWGAVGIFRAVGLTKFSLSAGRFSPTELPLAWNQLTSLALQDISCSSSSAWSSDRALRILAQCPELRTCHLAILDTDSEVDENAGSRPVVECRFLETMDLSCFGVPAFTLERLFSRLSLPKLRHFKLSGSSSESHSTLSLSSFLAVATQLESLEITTDTFSKASLIAFLRGLPPTLQRLAIAHGWIAPRPDPLYDEILAILTPSADEPSPCCPALREFCIRQCVQATDAALLRFIDGRMESGSPLERVEASFFRQRQVDILPSLQRFVDGGLRVSLKYFPPRGPSAFSPWLGLTQEEGPFSDDTDTDLPAPQD